MKKVLKLVASLALVFCLLPTNVSAAEMTPNTTWYDEELTSYEINSAEELFGLASLVDGGNNFAGKIVKLGSDIDLAGYEWLPIGGSTVYFRGEFDGQSHTITNMTSTTGNRFGLFGLVEYSYLYDFTLKDVKFTINENSARVGAVAGNLQYWNVLEDITIDGIEIITNANDGLIGTVTGYNWKSQLDNVDVNDAVITANGTGNVIGGNTGYGRAHVWDTNVTGNNAHWLDGTVQNIEGTEYVLQNYYINCDVNTITINLNGTGSEAGGFFGSDTYNSHSNFFVDCTVNDLLVNCKEDTSQTAGGFIAWNNGTTTAGTVKGFEGCSVNGTINGSNGIYGGFAGQVGGRACEYNGASTDVNITSTGTAGGFVGATQAYSTHKYTFNDCTATGNVSGHTAGGFVGKAGLSGDGKSVYVDILNCTATGSVNASKYAGGLVGEVNPELPATNWNTVDSEGSLRIEDSIASSDITVDSNGYKGSLIGYADTCANGDAKEGNIIYITVRNNTVIDSIDLWNFSDDTLNTSTIINNSEITGGILVDNTDNTKPEAGICFELLNINDGDKVLVELYSDENLLVTKEFTFTEGGTKTCTFYTVGTSSSWKQNPSPWNASDCVVPTHGVLYVNDKEIGTCAVKFTEEEWISFPGTTDEHLNTNKENVKPNSCDSKGYTGDIICTDCGELVEKGTETPALGHTYENGVCKVCGNKEPSVTPDPDVTPTPTPTPKPEKDPIKTGDDTNIALFAGLAILAAGSMYVLRRKEEL